jgi:putative redox protein
MNYEKVNFKNANGDDLVGYLELPTNQVPHSFALLAHCFTCNKNFFSVKNISNALSAEGFGVLRFDFTGLGESEGDFSDSNFSGNVEDLIVAAEYLKEHYKAPELLIGHSLGGAAAIFAAQNIKEVKALATIGTPSTLKHVTHLLQDEIETIKSSGMASVTIGGRPFKIKKQFLDDLETRNLGTILAKLRKPILIMHSPEDSTVEIKNAEELYLAAKHPKSFISLSGADHLLSKKEDSNYAGELIGSWAKRYIEIIEVPLPDSKHEVVARLGDKGFTTYMKAGHHDFIADEPISFGGKDFGPSPYDLISGALAACTSMTIQMYARKKKWALETVETHVNHLKTHALDCENCESPSAKIDTFHRDILLKGDLDEEQKLRILKIANRCPVHKTLEENAQIITKPFS